MGLKSSVFLGHISSKGVKVDPAKIEAITKNAIIKLCK